MIYDLDFSDKAKKDISDLKKSDIAVYKKLQKLLLELMEHPYTGTGKPKLMKYDYSGQWSRKINDKHRILYSVDEEIITVFVITAKGYYDDK